MPSDTTTRRLLARGAGSNPVIEFLRALGEPHTYLPWRNAYALFGFLWGLPIPFFSMVFDTWGRGADLPTSIHLFFALHPFLFSIVFGAMGSVRRRKDRHIVNLMQSLRKKVGELEVANGRLTELDRLRSEFVANVTHELKTPLVAIRGYTEMFLEGRLGGIAEKQRCGMETVLRNADRLQQQIDDLLQIERLDSGRLQAKPREFVLQPLVETCLEVFRPQAEARRIHLETEMPAAPLRVVADREMIGHVLTNLLANSVKFTGADGHVKVRISNGDRARVQVLDDGCGIPEEAQPYVFDRFRQADGSSRRRHGGVGLGLAIVKSILDLHHVDARLDSRVGRGTTIEFDLPVPEGGSP